MQSINGVHNRTNRRIVVLKSRLHENTHHG